MVGAVTFDWTAFLSIASATALYEAGKAANELFSSCPLCLFSLTIDRNHLPRCVYETATTAPLDHDDRPAVVYGPSRPAS